jgi:Xaa-Pro aminopeptidase
MNEPRHEPKIRPGEPTADYTNAAALGTIGNPAHAEWARAGLEEPNLDVMRAYRLERIRAQLRQRDFAGAVLTDPLNVRYATDSTNMQVWCMHNDVRYAFIATDGPVVLFDFHSCGHLSSHLPLIDETRPATSWFYFESGHREDEHARNWAREIAELLRAHGSGNRRLAIDKVDPAGYAALMAEGLDIIASQEFTEEARKVKHPEELKAMRRSIFTTEVAMAEMWRNLHPGITENQLWSILHQLNIARGGEWIETRLLASGPRTNPWFHECSDRIIEAGDIVAFDTDLIGPYGYCADISRSWVTPGRRPTNEQVTMHAIGLEHINTNMSLIKAGVSFLELGERAHILPEEYRANRYSVFLHGVGLCDEYPAVRYPEDVEKAGYDGVFEPGMCVCIEAYIGREDGAEGVKLERQAVVTETGIELLDRFPMDLIPEV